MAVQSVDKYGTLEAIPLTPAQRALLITFRRVLISTLHLIDCLLGK